MLLAVQYVFMDNVSYEERRVKKDDSWAKFLQEGADVSLVLWNNKVITVDIPNVVELLVTRADPGLKGNSATGKALSWGTSLLVSCVCMFFRGIVIVNGIVSVREFEEGFLELTGVWFRG